MEDVPKVAPGRCMRRNAEREREFLQLVAWRRRLDDDAVEQERSDGMAVLWNDEVAWSDVVIGWLELEMVLAD